MSENPFDQMAEAIGAQLLLVESALSLLSDAASHNGNRELATQYDDAGRALGGIIGFLNVKRQEVAAHQNRGASDE